MFGVGSPPALVTRARITCGVRPSLRKAMWPSQKTAIAPPGWKLKISSLGPQLLVLQGQLGGPPTGVPLLLMGEIVPLLPGGPETPLPVSGSAQRLMMRLPPVMGSVYLPTMVGYC